MDCIDCEILKKDLLEMEVETIRLKKVLSNVAIEASRDKASLDKINDILDSIYFKPKKVGNDKTY